MTFEEFLIKKKIDPALFKSGEKLLFLEFESHFSQMGEKSFDHSKKFWFNKLRRAHPLKEVPKPDKPLEPETQKSEITTASVVIASQETIPTDSEGKASYKPRFKAASTSTEEVSLPQPEETNSKPAFKPRFRAGITSVPKEAENIDVVGEKKKETENAKPVAYKPRFKAAMSVNEKASDENINTPPLAEGKNEVETSKPVAYKPRFKPSMAVKEVPSDENGSKNEPKIEEIEKSNPAYKPRFKPSIMKKKEE